MGIFTMIDRMIVTTFTVVVMRGNHPPGLLADAYILHIYGEIIHALSSVSRSRMRSADTLPLRTLTTFGSLLAVACILFSLNAGNDFVVCIYLRQLTSASFLPDMPSKKHYLILVRFTRTRHSCAEPDREAR